jgi:hypothetical protein
MDSPYDHLGKTIGHSALCLCGPTEMEAVIAPNPRRADLRHEPDPARDAERARLGLLGRIASIVCLIELYSGAPERAAPRKGDPARALDGCGAAPPGCDRGPERA